ncbi:hypothetical protein ACQ4WQ_08530 [Janthinobacterium sp. GB1R12]|uniref:hypothetical protein n=1 Tax=Janthinobacterium sp. GB1R12 TaxID=3424190 RepID=UPI003F26A1B9
MNIHDIEWRSYCCGDACQYAEVATEAGFLQVKTSHEAADSSYLVRRYGKDRMPLDADYVPMTVGELEGELQRA